MTINNRIFHSHTWNNFHFHPQDMGVTTENYAMLYALYSWPNVVLSCLGGYLIDKVFGIRLAGCRS